MAANVMEIYGSKVFNEHVMKERLPSATYIALSKEIVEMHGWKLSAKNDRHGICLSMVCHS